ncbi:MAG: hypothetical protein JXR37_08450 [Kiritimatiellae bacterium]|nr:hypothetical protein [Kiritimatiellia bacterium]
MAAVSELKSPDGGAQDARGPSALWRGLAILRLCADACDGATFTALRRACGDVPPTTLARLLRPLLAQGMLRKLPDTGRYAPGAAFVGLAHSVLGRQPREQLVQPVLDALANATGESAAYYEWDGDWLILRAKAEQPESFHYSEAGARHWHRPMNAFFRVCQAYLPADTVADIFRRYTAQTGRRERPKPRQLAAVRRNGVLSAEEPVRGIVTRIAAPAFLGEGGACAGAAGITTLRVGLAGPARAELEAQVKRAAAELTRAFTHLR